MVRMLRLLRANRRKAVLTISSNIRHVRDQHTSSYTVPLIINGKDVTTTSTFPVVGCLKNETIWDCSSVDNQNLEAAINGAQDAFPVWSATKPSERRDIFLRAAEIFLRRKEEFGSYMHEEIGANDSYKDFIIGLAVEGLKDTAGRIAGAVTGQVPTSIHNGMRAMTLKCPYGVVLGVAPW